MHFAARANYNLKVCIPNFSSAALSVFSITIIFIGSSNVKTSPFRVFDRDLAFNLINDLIVVV